MNMHLYQNLWPVSIKLYPITSIIIRKCIYLNFNFKFELINWFLVLLSPEANNVLGRPKIMFWID